KTFRPFKYKPPSEEKKLLFHYFCRLYFPSLVSVTYIFPLLFLLLIFSSDLLPYLFIFSKKELFDFLLLHDCVTNRMPTITSLSHQRFEHVSASYILLGIREPLHFSHFPHR
ncbi:hypothetical protein V8G54_004980, partial [Vigna mungo]